MKQEIKERVDRIRKGEVPEGYRKTKVGIIPEDWNIKKLSQFTAVITKGTTPTSLNFSFQEKGINFIKTENIAESGYIYLESTLKISDECDLALQRSRLENNDILFSIAGSLGTVAIVTEDCLPANTNQALAIIRLKELDEVRFFLKILKSEYVNRFIYLNTSTGAQPNLNLDQIGKIGLPMPKKSERQKIANKIQRIC